jgi:ABC-type transport system involved in multi-copper enzyme maturation permease subunit
MSHQLRSELLKLRTTSTAGVLLLAACALTLLAVLLEGLSPTVRELANENTQREMFSAVTSAVLFATFAGVIAVTSEFRYGTIRPTLLIEPRRRVVLGAKLIAAALTGIVIGVICVAIAFGAGLSLLAARDVDLALTGTHALLLVFGTIAVSGLSAMLGVAIGTLIRNQAGAIVAVVAYSVAVDATLFATVPALARWLPGKAGDALIGLPKDHLLAPAVAAAVLAAWTLTFVVAATLHNDRSDV